MSSATLNATPVRAVLFDLDGTLIDTESHYRRAVKEWLAASGLLWDKNLEGKVRGLASLLLADLLISLGVTGTGRDEMAHLIDQRVEADVRESGVPWKPGALELVNSVVASPLSAGLVTMSCRSIVDLVLPYVASPGFDVVITGESVSSAKPAPDAYLLAAQTLNVDPGSCAAVEDSLPGATAARSAGMWVVGAHLEDPLPGNVVDEAWPSLLGRTETSFTARNS